MFLSKLSVKEKTGLLIGVIFLVVAFLDRLIISPINNRIQQINQEIKTAEKQLERDLRNLNQKEVITKEYQGWTGDLKKTGSDEEEIAKVLAEVEGFARKAGIYLVDMKPRLPADEDFYKEYSAEIELEGDMTGLVTFLYHLNNSTQILRAQKTRLALKLKDSNLLKVTIIVTKILIR